ncbi:alpha/beta hydrolase-fold protein [Corynebacterium comes]|uniref:Diacylglycerol acyltransferase/mycolyltransferase Ag85C n=1 Tax=Corynebacterium comes TaxID=2675218 RepID=A0A6B8W135_9CORY|nr:alpha/beta hydrolase-fold protein [Corynebacterium comes]QGU05717.1 Diacylglycerol acyltransferase/mycolyltransferase Ag85C precursor [Corynebacterium comes]
MRDTASRSPQRRRTWLAALVIPTTVALGLSLAPAAIAQSGSSLSDSIRPSDPPQRTPVSTEYPDVQGLPAGVDVQRIEWITNRRVALFIESAAMPGELIQVQMLLARDWHLDKNRTFPEVWALDGLRAREDDNGWTIETNIEQFYADKNVNVILPVGGESSFYADWQQPNNGKNYQWETFLMKELVPILDNGFRSSKERAVFGLSMGGTAAMNLAQRYPNMFKFVGSFSGYLDTTSPGMPEAILAAQTDAGGYNGRAMWGAPGHQDWIDHDPKLGVEALKGTKVYVSAGSGRDDFGEANSVATGPANSAGISLEILSRMTSQTFVDRARQAGIEPTVHFRPSGVHAWPYWQFEMTQAWPHIANALSLSEEDKGADCVAVGAIAEATRSGVIGSCVNNEYSVEDGVRQDFRNGVAYWSPDTGAHALVGAINARYHHLGGPASWLGFPTTGERVTPDGAGRYVHFENGSIYWTARTGAQEIPGPIFEEWGSLGWERSDLGYPVAPPTDANGGQAQQFQNGWIIQDKAGQTHSVKGAIAAKYGEMGTANSALGFPTSDERLIRGGAFQEFENGNIYWSAATGAHFIKKGAIFNHWGTKGWEQGEFGWPVADQTTIPAGGETVRFQNGTISEVNGRIQEVRN